MLYFPTVLVQDRHVDMSIRSRPLEGVDSLDVLEVLNDSFNFLYYSILVQDRHVDMSIRSRCILLLKIIYYYWLCFFFLFLQFHNTRSQRGEKEKEKDKQPDAHLDSDEEPADADLSLMNRTKRLARRARGPRGFSCWVRRRPRSRSGSIQGYGGFCCRCRKFLYIMTASTFF